MPPAREKKTQLLFGVDHFDLWPETAPNFLGPVTTRKEKPTSSKLTTKRGQAGCSRTRRSMRHHQLLGMMEIPESRDLCREIQ